MGDGITVKAVWHIVKKSARSIGVARLAPHDLRRTYARLCHTSGGELEQIRFLFGARFGANHRTLPWLAASSGFDQPSMMASASSRILELGAVVEALLTIRSEPHLSLPANTCLRPGGTTAMVECAAAGALPLRQLREEDPTSSHPKVFHGWWIVAACSLG